MPYTFHPAVNENGEFPPKVRQATAGSTEISDAVRSLLNPLVASAIAADGTVAAAAASAAGPAVQNVLAQFPHLVPDAKGQPQYVGPAVDKYPASIKRGSVSYVAGRFNKAANFEAGAAYLPTTGPSTAKGTFEAFINISASNGAVQVAAGNSATQMWLGVNGSGYASGGIGSTALISSTPIADGTWHHIAVTSDGTNWRLFCDGVLLNTTAGTKGLDMGSGFAFGEYGVAGTYPYTGLVQDVRLSKIVRYTGSYVVPSATLAVDADTLALYHLNGDLSNSVLGAADSVDVATGINFGSFYDVLMKSTPHVVLDKDGDPAFVSTALSPYTLTPKSALPSYADAKFGKGLLGGAPLSIQGTINVPSGTIEAWIKTAATGTKTEVVVGSSSSGLWLGAIGGVPAFGRTGNVHQGGATMSDGNWHHLALVVTGTVFVLYRDGVEVQRVTFTQALGLPSGAVGDYGSTQSATTYQLASTTVVDEIRISKSLRYSAAFTPATAPFVTDADTLMLLHLNASLANEASVDTITKFSSIIGSGGGGTESRVVIYANGAYGSRPVGSAPVTFIGPVEPTGIWLPNDEWKDNS